MRLAYSVIVIIVSFLLAMSVQLEVNNISKINEAAYKYKLQKDADYFIAESFRKTCNGYGFSSLNEWQVTCRKMWNLDYIGWSDASDFMNVNYENTEKRLMYGKWNGEFANGEVYCRKK